MCLSQHVPVSRVDHNLSDRQGAGHFNFRTPYDQLQCAPRDVCSPHYSSPYDCTSWHSYVKLLYFAGDTTFVALFWDRKVSIPTQGAAASSCPPSRYSTTRIGRRAGKVLSVPSRPVDQLFNVLSSSQHFRALSDRTLPKTPSNLCYATISSAILYMFYIITEHHTFNMQ